MTIFIDNKYTRWYHSIIGARLANPVAQGDYTESHHITPRSLGGSDDLTNLVPLTAREHFICHWLLTKITTGDCRVKMLRAFWGMKANKSGKRYINARAYDSLKTEYARVMSESMRGENNPMFGDKFYRSPEAEARRIEAITGDNNVMKSDSAKQAMRDLKTGVKRAQFSQEWLDNLTATRQGELNGMYGKAHREESKALQREKAEMMMWINDGSTSKRIYKTDAQPYLDTGWTQGRHYVKRGPRGPYKKKLEA